MQNNVFQKSVIMIGLVAATLWMYSCSDESIKADDVNFGFEYFPITSTKTLIYVSDSIIYDGSPNRVDTFRGYIREKIGESIILPNGQIVNKVERSFKRDLADPWVRTNTWTTYIENTRGVRTEENIPLIKLVFPFKKGTKWNGNALMDDKIEIKAGGQTFKMYEDWKYEVLNNEASFTINGVSYPSVVVTNVKDSSIFELRDVQETYAKDLGLVSKSMRIYLGDGSLPNEKWEKKASKGFRHTLRLIDIR